MRRRIGKSFGTISIILFVAACALSGCVGDFGDFKLSHRDAVEQTLEFNDGDSLSLENVNGRVSVRTWPEPARSEILIEAEKKASSEGRLDAIEIDARRTPDGVSVKTHFPKNHWMGSSGRVDYVITLPRSAGVHIETVNGRILVEDVNGHVDASTVNGAIRLTDVSGSARARTVNGSVRAVFDVVEPGSNHVYRTTNGSVKLLLPEDVSGRFEARTVNGSLKTDFPLDVSGKWGPKRLNGRLGSGNGSFEVKTVNGSVNIGKRS